MPPGTPMPAPERGQSHNPGPPVTPRPAATVIVLRGGERSLELLLVRRNPQARFMGGAWVFPGGAVDPREGEGDGAHRAAAIRELEEEAGVRVEDPAQLVPFSRWITPAQVSIRFDTHFFLVELPPGQDPRVDGAECVELGWFTPGGALTAHAEGRIELVFPTIKHLEQVSGFPSAQALLEHARRRRVKAVEPRVVMEGEVARIVLPGEPGY